MRTRRTAALAVSSVGIALGALGACTTTGVEEASCTSVGCVGYATAYPVSYAPYAMDSYYDPVGNELVSISFSRPDGGSLVNLDAGGPIVSDAQVPIADVPELLAKARAGTTTITDGVRLALDPIGALLDTTPLQGADSVTFGPVNRGNGTYEFTLRRLSTTEPQFGWKLEAKPVGSSGGFTLVAGGIIHVGDTAHLGSGVLGVDGDALSAADSSVHALGKLRLGFANDSSRKVLRFALDGFTPNVWTAAPIDATAAGFAVDQTESGTRVALLTNLSETATSAQELVVLKVHSEKGVGTRADAVATGGDVPATMSLLVSTCVSQSLDPASVQTSTKLCAVDGTGCVLLSGPETISCPGGLLADPPDADATADDSPAGLTDLPDLPATVPDGTL